MGKAYPKQEFTQSGLTRLSPGKSSIVCSWLLWHTPSQDKVILGVHISIDWQLKIVVLKKNEGTSYETHSTADILPDMGLYLR